MNTTPPAESPWHALRVEQCCAQLESTPEGLAAGEAQRRLQIHGHNVLERAGGEGPFRILWRQINNPLIWVLLASTVLAVAVGKVTDGLVVLAVVVLNSLIGFVQEYRASRAIEALSAMVPENVAVLRDGQRVNLPAAELVPGDVVLLTSGDKVPADLRLLAEKSLRVEEAALTGESVAVEKSVAPVPADAAIGDRSAMAFAGTLVAYGTATGLVVATGTRTELGRISTLLQQAVQLETPLTKALATIGKYITLAIVVMSAVMLAIGLARAVAAGVTLADAARETLVFAIALAVGAIPEGLPAIVTIALAIGVQRMAARRAIIRKLPAVETLGSTTVICSDKTGTLTRNEMTVVALWTPTAGAWQVQGVGYAPHGGFRRSGTAQWGDVPAALLPLLEDAVLCNDASLRPAGNEWIISGDPTEAALVVAGRKAGIDADALRSAQPRRDAIPFESENQFMATLHDGAARRMVVKGAPEAVLRRCSAVDADAVHAEVERLAREGMRVLALAAKPWPGDTVDMEDVSGELTFAGLVGMIDPPRPEAVAAVRACHDAGIQVKMITGDHLATARAIGTQLGLQPQGSAVSGSALAGMDTAALRKVAASTSVFARVAPEHKLMLVRALQDQGHVVAMTGDGVNDAPALKQSNIGVAMGITGTAVSKEAADVVLTDDNFASIVAAVEEGRRVYDNLIKSLVFVLPTNLGLALILTYALLFFPFDPQTQQLLLPLQPTQILWINLVATVALALPLAFEAREPDVMRRPPRDPDEPVLTRFVVLRTVVAAVVMTTGALALFQWEYTTYLGLGAPQAQALSRAQTMAVTAVIMFQIFYLLNCRSLRESVFTIGFASNPWILVGIAALLALQAAFVYAPPLQAVFASSPLGANELLRAALVGAVILPVVTLEKKLRRGARASG